MSINKKSDITTRVIDSGQEPDPTTGAVMMPVYLTLTYAPKSPRQHQGYEYSCSQKPMRFAYERYVADLESGQCGFTSASGVAATGDHSRTLANRRSCDRDERCLFRLVSFI
nr:PLP-dependent transferase [Candidatus Coxiella mudrowiae]